MGKIGPFVGKDETIGPVERIGPSVGIGLFGGTGPVVSLTYIKIQKGMGQAHLRQTSQVKEINCSLYTAYNYSIYCSTKV